MLMYKTTMPRVPGHPSAPDTKFFDLNIGRVRLCNVVRILMFVNVKSEFARFLVSVL